MLHNTKKTVNKPNELDVKVAALIFEHLQDANEVLHLSAAQLV